MHAARTTMPSVPITDAAFVYRNSASTNVVQTWETHRQRMREQQQAERRASKPRSRPPLMPMRRVRAGTAAHLSMPLFEESAPC